MWTSLTRLGILVLAVQAARAPAAEPQAAFALKNGWGTLVLRQDGQPLADAIVEITDERGVKFGQGETDTGGQAEFPVPGGSSFLVEIKAQGRAADPIRLYKLDGGIAPGRVLLSYGLRPCCRFKSPREVASGPAAPPAPPAKDLARDARADLDRRSFRPLSTSLRALLADPKYEPIPTQTSALLLQPAPDFTLPDLNGQDWSLAPRLKEGPVVLVFYYGYHCDHCVSQLFALDKDLGKFRELGVQVVAVSADPPELTRERGKQYGAFGFPVLSDRGNKVAQKYETYLPNPDAGKEGDLLHGTFVVARNGRVAWVNRGDGPFTENRTLLHEIARLEGRP